MLKGVSSLDQLTPYQKTDLSNSLDEIKATLLANEGNRQICHRERKTGSNLIALRCETVADREAHARESQPADVRTSAARCRPRTALDQLPDQWLPVIKRSPSAANFKPTRTIRSSVQRADDEDRACPA